ncbi:DUF3224 domain-containing protein [Pseudoduganella chitinolytica]|uniref:DUF3224 domain-containing protein n=1 Tax=Pseudoduganella chitinolytica TaxID=34070 RepID=A0ABY8BDQ2_9BURK|nr:DUF3224 domain-containing protein [Pseudoduganella chitinolytica]WEF33955.1 DUF3224 domain-containing protein [Pseudoduganella chitinolytica]
MESTSVTGTFEIAYTPAGSWSGADDPASRMTFTKTYAGPLAGTSSGEMLTAGRPGDGSAGYVALERFTGTLAGRHGSCVLQHSGTMLAGRDSLLVVVTPGSGSGDLAGIAGTLALTMEDGVHRYRFDYALPLPAYSA